MPNVFSGIAVMTALTQSLRNENPVAGHEPVVARSYNWNLKMAALCAYEVVSAVTAVTAEIALLAPPCRSMMQCQS
jgi:hypothetical protein